MTEMHWELQPYDAHIALSRLQLGSQSTVIGSHFLSCGLERIREEARSSSSTVIPLQRWAFFPLQANARVSYRQFCCALHSTCSSRRSDTRSHRWRVEVLRVSLCVFPSSRRECHGCYSPSLFLLGWFRTITLARTGGSPPRPRDFFDPQSPKSSPCLAPERPPKRVKIAYVEA